MIRRWRADNAPMHPMNTTVIPSYDLYRGDTLAVPFRFLRLDVANESGGGYNASEPHRHNYHEVFYFERGGGWHDIDFRRFPIEDGSIHFVNPGQVHLIRRAPESHGLIVMFTSDFFLGELHERDLYSAMWFLTYGANRPILRSSTGEGEAVAEAMHMLQREYESNANHREHLLHSYVNIMLVHALRHFEQTESAPVQGDTAHSLVYRLRRMVEEHFTSVHAPREYAEMLYVSQNHLNNTVRRLLGKTIGDLIQERIVLEARRLLFHTDLSVKEIAYQLNYDDPSYFTRFFRKHVGLSPLEFREAASKTHL